VRCGALLTLAAALLVAAPTAAAGAGRSEVIEIATSPGVSGVPFAVDGTRVRTGPNGRASVTVAAGRRHTIEGVARNVPRAGVRASFAHWGDGRRGLARSVDGTPGVHKLRAAYRVDALTRFLFVTPAGHRLDPRAISSITLTRSDGSPIVLHSGGPFWLPSRTAAVRDGRLRTRRYHYAIESVLASGSNVVNHGQQRFVPGGRVAVSVLFYSLQVRTRDAFFGFPVGSSATVIHPDGHESQLALADGLATATALPRGDYAVKIDVLGVGTRHELVVSRDEEATIRILGVYDALAVGAAFLAGSALLFVVGRRPALLRRRADDSPVLGQEAHGR
jgi:hypothetical protein